MTQDKPLHTLPLFDEHSAVSNDTPAIGPSKQWALVLSERDWLSFLAEEWWPTPEQAQPLLLGNGVPVAATPLIESVLAWVDPKKLPRVKVSVHRQNEWVDIFPEECREDDTVLAWHGALPLFSVERFSVKSAERSSHLQSVLETFANIDIPTQTFEVQPFVCSVFEANLPKLKRALKQPLQWNKLRGFAAMALWSVPAIAPWLDTLCALFNKPQKPSRTARKPFMIHAPWLARMPWQYLNEARPSASESYDMALWQAMIQVFSDTHIKRDWRPHLILGSLCDRAVQSGLQPCALDGLRLETIELLDDRKAIDVSRGQVDPLGLVMQLVLLRPDPESFMSWRNDLPLSPAVIWTGAMLSGLLCGFTDLAKRFKGSKEGRRLADFIVWSRASPRTMKWPDVPGDRITWQLNDHIARIQYGNVLWHDRKLGQRGQWYEADLADGAIENIAIELARNYAPSTLSKFLRLSDKRVVAQGSGHLSINTPKKELIVKGEVLLALAPDEEIITTLDHQRFKDWVATACLTQRLPTLPDARDDRDVERATPPPDRLHHPITGLSSVPDFITPESERSLIHEIDTSLWSSELKRRVQHYGWAYNYSSRRISQSSYLGPLPDWAEAMAQRLYDLGYMPEKADQVIVNEYLRDQGISKHIDCQTCFRGPVVTISLLETWSMLFRKGDEKVEVSLPQRSATIIDGPARHQWTHEIPQRKFENGKIRTRRISLTFRKIAMPAP